MNPTAPRVLVEYIPGDKIGEVIGPKGKIIREITEETGADVNIDDVDGRGVVHIYSNDGGQGADGAGPDPRDRQPGRAASRASATTAPSSRPPTSGRSSR